MASLLRISKPLLHHLKGGGSGGSCGRLQVFILPATHRHSSSSSQPQKRLLHDSPDMKAPNAATISGSESVSSESIAPPTSSSSPSPLSIIPFPSLLRSYLITSLTAYPFLLTPSMALLKKLAYSNSRILNPDKNVLLHWLLKRTFYAQYCAGETPAEVRATVQELKSMGYKGMIMGYAREVVLCGEDGQGTVIDEAQAAEDLRAWKNGTLETVKLAQQGDFVALKFTGAGFKVVNLLLNNQSPDPVVEQAIVEICELSKQRNVKLLFDAEQSKVQTGIDAWTLDFQRRYNKAIPGQAMVYGTYQAYLRSTPATLAKHLAAAEEEGFTVGVKLVRGAYLACDERSLFWSTKEETDTVYNSIAESLMRRDYGEILRAVNGEHESKFPPVNLVLASHNLESVKKAMVVRKTQAIGEEKIDLVYGQLMGMADDVGCELIHAAEEAEKAVKEVGGEKTVEVPRTYKYLVWGTVSECLKYLLRRGDENQEALTRTGESLVLMRKELTRRVFGA